MKSFNRLTLTYLLFAILSSCSNSSVFISKVQKVGEPDEVVELEVEKVESDYLYTRYFAVYDTLLIVSCPNQPEDNFYVSNLKTGELLGSFMHRGQGPGEFPGVTPVMRLEFTGGNLTALTYEPFNHQVLDWNITQSLLTQSDSIKRIGYYKDPNDAVNYWKIFRINPMQYVGYTHEELLDFSEDFLLPTYWILEGKEISPVKGISIVNKDACTKDNILFLSSEWNIKPDNSKIVDVMKHFEQINIIDLKNDKISSYRVKGSPGENILESDLSAVDYQYLDVACNDSSIYALYAGDTKENITKNHGAFMIHKFNWNGEFEAKYKISEPVYRLWLDPSNNTLYGYNEPEDVLIRIGQNL